MDNDKLELFASCLAGLERPLADELKQLGIRRVRPLGGGVAFFCDVRGALEACLWSRLASRITLVAGRADARDAESLYENACRIPWEDVVAPNASIAVHAHGTNGELRNTRFTALKVKDAVCDRLRDVRGRRPDVDAHEPDAAIDVRVRGERATLSLDLSGASLYRRTYLASDDGDEAPLECALAAGLLALAGWGRQAGGAAALVDAACGNGAVVVEAASVVCDVAPGLARDRWGFQGWARFDEDAWADLLEEADGRFERGLAAVAGPDVAGSSASAHPSADSARFVGLCLSSPALARARGRVKRAGLRHVASIERGGAEEAPTLVKRVAAAALRAGGPCAQAEFDGADGAEAKARAGTGIEVESKGGAQSEAEAEAKAKKKPETKNTALLIASVMEAREPSSEAAAQAVAAAFVAAAAAAPPGSAFAVAGGGAVEDCFGVQPCRRSELGGERVCVEMLVFDRPPAEVDVVMVPDSAGGAQHRVEVFDRSSEQFSSRLFKVAKERRKWARREGVSCYRVYDADLPEYNVAIDVYAGAGDAEGATYLHIAEYAPPASVDAGKARRRFGDVLALAPVALGVRPDHVFVKTRRREKGGGQYRDADRRPYTTWTAEGGYLFEIDLAGYLDTGLFLDLRPVRAMVGSLARGARFLNLFAYTGSATVHAAGGGAAQTTTVDLSQTYLDWARRNMEANGFAGPEHSFVRADAVSFVTDLRRSPQRFDLVFVDPPTFSNSKAMGRRTWDVQRDHGELLIGVSRILAPGGVAVFSCNLRTFKIDAATLAKYGVEVEDVTPRTIPHDFERNPKVHQCYLVRRAR